MKRRTMLAAALGAPAWWTAGRPAFAQTYPSRPIRLISPSPPGGGGDVSNRIIAKHMGDLLGQPMVVENRPGGNGVVAAVEALRAGNDGHTIFIGGNTPMIANPYLMKSHPFDPFTAFAPVSLVGTLPFILVVNPALPIRDVRELIRYARAQAVKLSFASANATSLVAASRFARMADIEMLHIPYKGAPASLNDIIGGQVALTFVDIPSARGLVQAGKLRVLAVTSAARTPMMPDVPSIAETGLAGYEVIGWTAMYVTAGTDPAIINRLSQEARKVIARPDVREQLAAVGFDGAPTTPEELGAFMRAERPRWVRMIREAGIEPE